jgi:hypothetical protein
MDTFAAQAQALQESIKHLQTLAHTMQSSPGVFDQEDIQCVHDYLSRDEERLQHITLELNKRKHLYESTVLKLESLLQRRTDILGSLDDSTRVFQFHPELMQTLVDKQVHLSKYLDTMKDMLNAPLFPEKNDVAV